ncbi:MAG TPA: hypothetical protein VKA84_20940 [Gemmatimonadaceae bacterium]|nr:hypothetical protein [Gemmatimonadaceae bacterium]
MSEHALPLHLSSSSLLAPAAAATAAPAALARPAFPAEGELSDDDLEHVIGGLARAWVGGAPGLDAMGRGGLIS